MRSSSSRLVGVLIAAASFLVPAVLPAHPASAAAVAAPEVSTPLADAPVILNSVDSLATAGIVSLIVVIAAMATSESPRESRRERRPRYWQA
jgi:hypothetical protein